MLSIDDNILNLIHSTATPWMDLFAGLLTRMGGTTALLLVVAVALLLIYRFRRKYEGLLLLLSVVIAALSAHAMKLIIARPRPDLWISSLPEYTYSMPSAHAAFSMALALVIVSIFWRTRYRVLVLLIASMYVIVIAYTRMYLGVHYPSDILVGWLVGGLSWYSARVIAKRFSK